MRLLGILAAAAIVLVALAVYFMRPAPEAAVVSNAVADQQAIDQANSDIENEQRAAAANLAAPAGTASNPVINAVQNTAR